jgi:eukaryotic-like serine/threonine-protein kinase
MKSNSTIGHYTIVSALGKGGMGEVYLAEDTKLDRQVAIKVLPESLRKDEGRLERFRREARASASLKHPNIATIYSIEEADDLLFIVMEYVEGKTLAEHIPSEGMELDDFFPVFIPLADALAHAHDNGRIHRDIKPGNIMLTHDGTPKILDFGLARIDQEGDVLESDTPTMTMEEMPPSLTQGRSFLGTPAYMSPEQIEGTKVDARTDIFSFGVVMYEALTGQRPFKGDTVESVLARILEIDPEPATELKPTSPYMLWQVIRKCLVKEREERMQTAREMRRELEAVQGEMQAGTVLVDARTIETQAADVAPAEPVPDPIPFLRQPAGIVLMAALTLMMGLTAAWLLKPTPYPPLRKFQLSVDTDRRSSNPMISPDGAMIAYLSGDQLWIQDLDRTEPRAIAGTEGAHSPAWSPNSEFVAYVIYPGSGTVWKVSAKGGTPVRICDMPPGANAPTGRDITWSEDGTILISRGYPKLSGAGIYTVPAQGGTPRPFMLPDSTRNEWGVTTPYFLPGGKAMLLNVKTRGEAPQRYAGSVQYAILRNIRVASSALAVRSDDGEHRLLSLPGNYIYWGAYSPTGHLIYATLEPEGHFSIWAVPFSLSSLDITGEPFVVAQKVTGGSVSGDRTLVYHQIFRPLQQQQLAWVDRSGTVVDTIGQPHEGIQHVSLSPDNRQVAASANAQSNWDIWVHDVVRDTASRLTIDQDADSGPVWSPTGERIAYSSAERGVINWDIYLRAADGSGKSVSIISGPENDIVTDWSRDGEYLLYTTNSRGIRYMPVYGERAPVQLLNTSFREMHPQFSPDGRFVAYTSGESGRNEIYVTSFPSGQGRWQASVNGGTWPRWSPLGDELFFITDNKLMALRVRTASSFEPADTPQMLFEGDRINATLTSRMGRAYDVSTDGRMFVVAQSEQGTEAQATTITVVQNWIREFDREK